MSENREKPFNENTMKMKIRPPRLNGDKVSIFSTVCVGRLSISDQSVLFGFSTVFIL